MTTDREVAGRINATILPRYATLLLGGAPEPVYLPAVGRARAIIRYTHDYAQSVLHEIAHWCLAGRARRLLTDYGYWYVPPPRSSAERAAFFAAEERVQALESILADACQVRFHISVDQPGIDAPEFAQRVAERAAHMRREGIRGRAREVLEALRGLNRENEPLR